jgi:methylglutaconyl-CoA hydratase
MEIFQTIRTEQQQAVFTIWLNRPDKHNALNQLMISELTQAFESCANAETVRVIVLRGTGKSFCAGADLQYMHDISAFGPEENAADAMKLASLFEKIYQCPKPVIAILHGAVYGGANGLLAAADIVLAHEDTVFAFSEVKLGITPATISPYVIRRCGQAAARELMLTGRKFTAQEAYRFLLVNLIFTEETLEAQLQFYSGHLHSAAPGAVSLCKQLIHDVSTSALKPEEMMKDTASRIAFQRASAEGQEGIKAFFEKRKPNWINE